MKNIGNEPVEVDMGFEYPPGVKVEPHIQYIRELKPGESKVLTFKIITTKRGEFKITFFMGYRTPTKLISLKPINITVVSKHVKKIQISLTTPSVLVVGSRLVIEGYVKPVQL